MERLQFYIKHSFNDLKVNGIRTIFGLFCIGAGVAAIVSLLTLGVMIEDTLSGGLQESNRGDIRHVPFAFGSDEDSEFDSNIDQAEDEGFVEDFSFTDEGKDRIIAWYANYFNVSPDVNCEADAPFCITYRYELGEASSGLFISSFGNGDSVNRITERFIVETDFYPLYGKVLSEDGKTLQEMIDPTSYAENETGDIVISRNHADLLHVEVGDSVRLNGVSKDFTVRGIVPTRTEGGLENLGAGILGYYYVDAQALDIFSDVEKVGYSQIYVRLDDPSQVDTIGEAFEDDYSFLGTITTSDLEDSNELIATVVTQLVSIMGLISMLIGGIGIINTMLVIVRRRTNEVAVLKTLGLKPDEISVLFLVEAVIMGILGSILGILLGFAMVFVIKGVAEAFLAQDLKFRIAASPMITGMIVGTLTTTIFGLLPTIAASQVRPATVLRPQDNIVPAAGRSRSFAAMIIVILALSAVTQGMLSQILDIDGLRLYASIASGIMGFLVGLALLIGGVSVGWAKQNIALRVLRWGVLLVGFPIVGAIVGNFLPAVFVMIAVVVIVSYLFVLLWLLIWAAGGGRIEELWPTMLILAFPLFWPLLPLLIVLVGPIWALGWVIQRWSFIDFKIAMRSMLANKGRGASTLVALVVGIFTLSLITMLVATIRTAFEDEVVDLVGGNLIAFVAGQGDSLKQLETKLEAGVDGVKSYGLTREYNIEYVSFTDASKNTTMTLEEIDAFLKDKSTDFEDFEALFDNDIDTLSARSVDANLPDVSFYAGRQLNQSDLNHPVIVVPYSRATEKLGYAVGDQITVRFVSSEDPRDKSEPITFTIVGLMDFRNGQFVTFGSNYYVPLDFLPVEQNMGIDPGSLSVIIDADEDKISSISSQLLEIPGVFVLETRVINDLLNKILDQFTNFPIIVAALALFTGGIVIANSVALSMMERRREIAIMKAVGLQRRRVLGMLLLENGLMGFVGGLIGVGISSIMLLSMLISLFDEELGKVIPYGTALLLMALCIGIALVAAIISVWGASSEKPLNVLRYE
ncbi:MAG: ABC transporter permease [Anaerolineales bacterium]|nr:ABC transporter permease [Anaerolineales bacterium]